MIWIFRHSDRTPAGTNYLYLQLRKQSYREFMWGKNRFPPPPEEVTWAIFLGGTPNVDEEHLYPWLAEEKQWIREYLKLERPYLGICLGGQLLADALGAKVGRHEHTELGWHHMRLNNQAHPYVHHSPREMQVFQFHSYCFQTPAGAVPFATNDITEHQGFIYKDFAIGLQFHPESDATWIQECTLAEPYPQGDHVQTPEVIRTETDKYLPAMQSWYYQLLDQLLKKMLAQQAA